jgi:hypothetical protein
MDGSEDHSSSSNGKTKVESQRRTEAPKFSKFLVIPNHRIREAGGVCWGGAPVPCQVYREGPKQGSWGPRVVKRTPQLERGGLNSNIIFTCADFISTPSL